MKQLKFLPFALILLVTLTGCMQKTTSGGDESLTNNVSPKSNQDATTSISRGGMIRISFKNKRFPNLFYRFLKFFMI